MDDGEGKAIGQTVLFRGKSWVVVRAARYGFCDGCEAFKSRRCSERHKPPCALETTLRALAHSAGGEAQGSGAATSNERKEAK